MAKKKKKGKEATQTTQIIRFFIILVTTIFSIYTIETIVFSNSNQSFDDFSNKTISIKIKNSTYKLDTHELFYTKTDSQYRKTNVGFLRGFPLWLGITSGNPPEHLINTEYLSQHISKWSKEQNIQAPEQGYIYFENTELVYERPQAGSVIDQKHLSWKLYTLIRSKDRKRDYTIYPRIKNKQSPIDQSYFDTLIQNIDKILTLNLSIVNTDLKLEHTLEKSDIATLLSFEPNIKTRRFEIKINELALYDRLQIYETESVNAGITIENNFYTNITPSRRGTQINKEQTTSNIIRGIETGKAIVEFALTETKPDISTQDIENLEIQHLVSSFTTHYSCCEPRTRNIQKFSEKVHGTIVKPNETIKLNTLVGRRTAEDGFEPAGTIVQGVLVETIGGGVSQFATTLFNALYWGVFTINSHTPHSRYFTRYPEGIEATISWPQPDLIFTNNTAHGMYIHTEATDTQITVSIFGNNDGRIIIGDHKHGQTTIHTKEEGGKNAKIVQSHVSERETITEPRQVYFVNKDMPPNTIFVSKHGRPSFKVQVTRTVSHNNTDTVWKRDVFYLAEDAEFETSSCDIIPAEAYCTSQEEQEEKKNQIEEFYRRLEDTF